MSTLHLVDQSCTTQILSWPSDLLEMSHGNSKLPNSTMLFSLPAGHSCPGALLCLSKADRHTGRITDGPDTQFRCYAASAETRPTVRALRWRNFERLRQLDEERAFYLLYASVLANRRPYTKRFRGFESGDCYSRELRNALIRLARACPELVIYLYSKNLPLFLEGGVPIQLPDNLFLTASWGGRYDHLIKQGLFPRNARVVNTHEEAAALGLPIDFTDELAYDPHAMAFAHLSHGTQPAGSAAGLAIRARAASGEFAGYSDRMRSATTAHHLSHASPH